MSDTPWHETRPEYQRRMSDDGVGGLASPAQEEANVSESMDSLGTVFTDVVDIPSTANVRPAGVFSDGQSAKEYLDRGGLLVTDAAGIVQPIGFIYLLEEFDEVLEQTTWTAYIDTKS